MQEGSKFQLKRLQKVAVLIGRGLKKSKKIKNDFQNQANGRRGTHNNKTLAVGSQAFTREICRCYAKVAKPSRRNGQLRGSGATTIDIIKIQQHSTTTTHTTNNTKTPHTTQKQEKT